MTFIFMAFGKKMDKTKFIACADHYMVFKTFFNSIWMMILVSLIASRYNINELIVPLIFAVIYYPYTMLETYFVMRKVNEYRKVTATIWDFFKKWGKGIVFNSVGIWLIILLDKNIGRDLFMLVLYLFALIFPWFQIYLSGLVTQGLQTDKYEKILKEKYGIDCSVKMYVFNGKINKNANAYVAGILSKKRIMISDYLMENLSEEEMCAILCHEISHCVNFDTEAIALLINSVSLLMITMGLLFELFQIPIVAGSIIVIGCVLLLIFGVMAFRRAKEYKADRYVVDMTGEYKVFTEALSHIYELNDTLKKRNKWLYLFESHPQLDVRIQHIKKYYEKRAERLSVTEERRIM